MEPFREL
jgi:hypothetical protein